VSEKLSVPSPCWLEGVLIWQELEIVEMAKILHFGLGNFHRAHQAWYTDLANREGGTQWSITGVSLRSSSVRDILQPQDGDYTLVISGQDGTRYEKITVLDGVLVAGEDTAEILAAIANADTQIISLTITEKGYHLQPDTGRLDMSATEVQSDLAGAQATIYGLLTRGLQMRRDAKSGPLTILCCDNLNANGDTVRAALAGFVAQADPSLSDYITQNVTFPNCMVDRITPATTKDTLMEVKANTGWNDAAPVATEEFSEWIIEDNFAASRPEWQATGAQMVDDVAPFELRKLRLLNGAHSYLAYAGTLRGYDYVNEATNDPVLRDGASAIMSEAAETLPDTIQASTPAYIASLLERFLNPHLQHKLRQIAMDGTLKLPIRLVATWKDRVALGLQSPAIEAAIAAWIGFAIEETKAGRALQDPQADAIAAACSSANATNALAALIGSPEGLIAKL
jgi:fructuronate reductase